MPTGGYSRSLLLEGRERGCGASESLCQNFLFTAASLAQTSLLRIYCSTASYCSAMASSSGDDVPTQLAALLGREVVSTRKTSETPPRIIAVDVGYPEFSRRKSCRNYPIPVETIKDLRASGAEVCRRERTLAPFLYDPRGNIFPVYSFGHIHHPFHQVPFRWAYIVENVLEKSVVGLRAPLLPGIDCYQQRPRVRDPVVQ